MREIVEGQKISYELERDNKVGQNVGLQSPGCLNRYLLSFDHGCTALLKAKPLMRSGIAWPFSCRSLA